MILHKLDWSLLLYEPYKTVYEMLYDLYIIKDWGMEQVADHIGVHKFSIRRKLVEQGIPLKGRGGKRKETTN